ncbi:MAG: hypothetical protein CO170_03110 [candidate division SR1 bacterium CG_4_9_14_3_um_filter_40_9]|nr:MAG: hypothetical protein CO170_03110 [candidate division SR1 bacterium CG_4_9_14_3_um_filter_40_9]
MEKNNMTSYIFDTSFLISLVDINDINHAQSVEIMKDLTVDESRFFINDLIYSETITVLTYKKGTDSLDVLESFLNKIRINFVNSNMSDYVNLFKSLRKKVSIADISVVYDSIKYNTVPLCFDKEIMKIIKQVRG